MKKEELKKELQGPCAAVRGRRAAAAEKKGQKGIVHAIFSRFGLVLVLLLLQVLVLFSIFRWFGNLLPHYFGGTMAVTAGMVIYLLNSKMDNSAKITWMVVIAIPAGGGHPPVLLCQEQFRPQLSEPPPDGAGGSAPHPSVPEPGGRAEAGTAGPRRGIAG